MAGTWDSWSLCVQYHEAVSLFLGSETRFKNELKNVYFTGLKDDQVCHIIRDSSVYIILLILKTVLGVPLFQ